MSRPPTPVLGCPLRQLEVQDGAQSRLYDSTHFASALTLTLDGQRSVDAEYDSLVLLVHCGPRRMLSIRLSDLLQSAEGGGDAVAVDGSSRRLAVKIPAQRQEIKAIFENGRDFSLAVCTLKKSGFDIKNDGPETLPWQAPSPPQGRILPNQTPGDLGPRLSSITPLPGLDTCFGSGGHSGSSFASLLDFSFLPSDSPHAALSDGTIRRESPQQTTYALPPLTGPDISRQRMTANEASQFLNPYNVFLNKQNSSLHQPRVGSPLRNAIGPDDYVAPRQSSDCAYPTEQNEFQARGSRQLLPRSMSSSSGLPLSRNSLDPMQPPESSNRRYSDGTATDYVPQTDPLARHQPSTSFSTHRGDMPQRRDLPFKQHEPQSTKYRVTKFRAGTLKGGQQSASPDGEDGPDEARVKRRVAHKTNRNILLSPHLKTNDPGSSPGSLETAHVAHSSPETCLAHPHSITLSPDHPTVLLADTFMLCQVNKITSALLEQYESDISRGCDEGLCAQFYLERMQISRRDFWLSQLMDIN